MNGKSHVFVRSIRTASVILTVLFRRNACVKHRVAAWECVFIGGKKSGAKNKETRGFGERGGERKEERTWEEEGHGRMKIEESGL